MKISNTILFAAIGFGAYQIFKGSRKTYEGYEEALQHLEAKIHKVRSLNPSGGKLKMRADIKIINNSNKRFFIKSGDKIVLEEIKILNKSGMILATISPNISSINLPAKGNMIIENVPINADLSDLTGLLLTGLDMFSSESIMDAINIDLRFKAFGKTINI